MQNPLLPSGADACHHIYKAHIILEHSTSILSVTVHSQHLVGHLVQEEAQKGAASQSQSMVPRCKQLLGTCCQSIGSNCPPEQSTGKENAFFSIKLAPAVCG